MPLLPDGLYIAWSAAGGFATLALATGGRAIFTQWRANASSNRQAEDWTTITDAASDFCSGDEESAGIVLRALSRPSSQKIAIEALANLARVDNRVPESLRGRTEMVEQIRAWVARELAHSDAGRRCAGAEIVGALRLRACRGAVALATNDEEPEVRVAACRALAVVDPDHAVGVLLGLVERDGVWAADLLADIVSREDGAFSGSEAVVQRANEWAATPALLRLLSNGHIAGAERVMIGALDAEDDDVRASAAEALRESGTPDAVKALAGMLGDSNELIRLTAVRAIGKSTDSSYSMDLAAMLGDESRLVRFAAGAALAAMSSGRDLLVRASEGADPKAVEAAHLSLWQAGQAEQPRYAGEPIHGSRPSPDRTGNVDRTPHAVPFADRTSGLLSVDRLRCSPTVAVAKLISTSSTPQGSGARKSAKSTTPKTVSKPAARPSKPGSAALSKAEPKVASAAVKTAKQPARAAWKPPAKAASKPASKAVSRRAKPIAPNAPNQATPPAKATPPVKVSAKAQPHPTPKTPRKASAKTPAKPPVKPLVKPLVKASVVAGVAQPVRAPRPASALPRLSRFANALSSTPREPELVSPSR